MNGNSRDRRLQLLWLSASSLTGIYPHRRRLVLFGTRKRQALWETPVRFHLFCFARQLMKKNFFLSASLYFTWFHFVVQSTLANLRETVLEWQKDRKRFIISHQPRILATCKRFRKALFSAGVAMEMTADTFKYNSRFVRQLTALNLQYLAPSTLQAVI